MNEFEEIVFYSVCALSAYCVFMDIFVWRVG